MSLKIEEAMDRLHQRKEALQAKLEPSGLGDVGAIDLAGIRMLVYGLEIDPERMILEAHSHAIEVMTQLPDRINNDQLEQTLIAVFVDGFIAGNYIGAEK